MLAGLAGIINPDTFVVTKDNLLKVSTSAWRWWHLIVGAIVFFSGFGVFTGNVLARTIGVIAAIVSMISAFVYMSVYPIWGITIVAIDSRSSRRSRCTAMTSRRPSRSGRCSDPSSSDRSATPRGRAARPASSERGGFLQVHPDGGRWPGRPGLGWDRGDGAEG